MDGAVLITWRSPVRGRETAALALLEEDSVYYRELQDNGTIRAFRQYFVLTGNHVGGVIVLEGQVDRLIDFQKDARWLSMLIRHQTMLEDYSASVCIGGDAPSLDVTFKTIEQVYADSGLVSAGASR